MDKGKLLKDVSPHILYEISEKYEISYKDLALTAGHLRPKQAAKTESLAAPESANDTICAACGKEVSVFDSDHYQVCPKWKEYLDDRGEGRECPEPPIEWFKDSEGKWVHVVHANGNVYIDGHLTYFGATSERHVEANIEPPRNTATATQEGAKVEGAGGPLSNCCQAPIKTSIGDEGTGCWICTKCRKGCDPLAPVAAEDWILRFDKEYRTSWGYKEVREFILSTLSRQPRKMTLEALEDCIRKEDQENKANCRHEKKWNSSYIEIAGAILAQFSTPIERERLAQIIIDHGGIFTANPRGDSYICADAIIKEIEPKKERE